MELSKRPILQAIKSVIARPAYQPVAPFLYPFLSQQTRSASILSDLRENPGHYNKKIRRGRGPASGKGKTSGRGHKGQGQHGKVPAGFNGGQTPDEVVAGSRGFENPWTIELAPVNLDRIQAWIDLGRLDPHKPITLKELKVSRCVHQLKDGVKLLARGKGELKSKIHIITSRASEEAIAAVEAQGGTVTTRFYSNFAIKKIMKGEMDPMHSELSKIDQFPPDQQYKYRLPDPISRKELEYYRDHKKRGYLSYMVEDGHGPSLFFKNPFLRKARDSTTLPSPDASTPELAPKVVKKAEPKMW